MHVIANNGSRPIKAWVQPGEIEPSALEQLNNLATLPFIHPNGVAVMPDVHAGIGSTVGTVIATEKAIIPAAVGVDIGCGMNAVMLNIKGSQLPDSLHAIRMEIEKMVPVGRGNHVDQLTKDLLFHAVPMLPSDRMEDILVNEIVGSKIKTYDKVASQLGTLGGGNHFIEICLDEKDNVWVMLHSGSRGIGNQIGTYFINKAKENMRLYGIDLPDVNLAYLPETTQDFNDYVEAVHWAQEYALINRKIMLQTVLVAMQKAIAIPFETVNEAINCHHNYVELENHFNRNVWVTRKGAVRARKGDLGIIPGSMGQKSYIVRGKGNPESYCSCSHGAGRVMSRTEAKKRFSLSDLVAQTEGVECRKDADVIDEIPGAYKNLEQVMVNQADLVEVVHTLRAVLCVKG